MYVTNHEIFQNLKKGFVITRFTVSYPSFKTDYTMKAFLNLFLIVILVFSVSCGDSKSESESSESESSENTHNDFPNYVDSNNLRIFARQGVSTIFLNNVGITYDEMFKENSNVEQSMRLKYISISKDNHVFQRVGVDGMVNDSDFKAGTPPAPYADNVTDYIWEMDSEGADQIGEVIEHLLHTITNVVLYLTYSDWDYKDSSSPLYIAMIEAIDKEIYDISSYADLKNDEAYQKIITQEYAYWLILAEWDYYVITGKKANGITGNEEFKIGTPSEIKTQLPLGHKLYKDYVDKIFSIPNKDKIISIFP